MTDPTWRTAFRLICFRHRQYSDESEVCNIVSSHRVVHYVGSSWAEWNRVNSNARSKETARRLPWWPVIGISSPADLFQSLNEDWNWHGDVCQVPSKKADCQQCCTVLSFLRCCDSTNALSHIARHHSQYQEVFLKLKIIKIYLCNSVGQDQLCGLSL